LGSMSLYVARNPRPVGDGASGGIGCGMGGRASGPNTERVRGASSSVGQWRQVKKWVSIDCPPSAASKVWRHRVHRHADQTFPISHHIRGLPSGPSSAGSRAPTCPSPFPTGSRVGQCGWSTVRIGWGRGAGPGFPPRRRTRATAWPSTHIVSGRGGVLLTGKPEVGLPLALALAYGVGGKTKKVMGATK